MTEEAFESHRASILAFGCGGGGCNTITRLTGMGMKGAVTIAANTDAKHLAVTNADRKLLIGRELTRGLGAGGYMEIGKKAAEESRDEIRELLRGSDLVFLTCGLGGGTGTGSVPVIARIAREMGAIVIATVTVPFKMEGARVKKAEEGLTRLREHCDTAIIIENQRLLGLAGKKPLKEAFAVADDLIAMMIKGVTELISQPSMVNLDYADVKAIMHSGGFATIGVGYSDTNNRAKEAVEMALRNPLLDVDYEGATGALIQVIGGEDITLDEISMIGEEISKRMDPDATVMWGARVLPELRRRLEVITIITGVSSPYITGRGGKREELAAKRCPSGLEALGIPLCR